MQKIIAIVIAIIAVSGGSFYGGMKYDQSKVVSDRQARIQQFSGTGGQRGSRGGAQGANLPADRQGFTSGEIIAKDEKSFTVKLRDGGSKIVFFTDKTPVAKSVSGSPADLAIGTQVVANGQANPDGSLNAETIQLRPDLPSL